METLSPLTKFQLSVRYCTFHQIYSKLIDMVFIPNKGCAYKQLEMAFYRKNLVCEPNERRGPITYSNTSSM